VTEKQRPGERSPNVVWHQPAVKREDRIRLGGQRGAVLWFTGLSGSGKSTIASAAEHRLNQAGKLTYLLDGDNVRMGLCADLGFSAQDRKENNRRMAHLARLFWDANVITFVSFISPFRHERDLARGLVGGDFVEIYVDTPLEVCEGRDPKGLYGRARKGEIQEFTGISSPYEPPGNPELTLRTAEESVDQCVERILGYLKDRKFI
jgi:adenylylsulfate kinase